MSSSNTAAVKEGVEASQAAAEAMTVGDGGERQDECVECRSESAAAVEAGLDASNAAARDMSVAASERAPEDLMDPSTFVPPVQAAAIAAMPTPLVVIEYCQRCKFGLRANWIQQELLSTFAPTTTTAAETSTTATTASIASVLLIPKVDDASAGRFRVYFGAAQAEGGGGQQGLQLVWDRKVQAGFPEMKLLKQKVRDLVNPHFGLGHSDRK